MKAKKILLVEDNRNLATALSMRLSAAGYQIILARTVAEAISRQQSRKPDVLLLDINLPDGSGFSLVDQIQNNPNISIVPIVFITASSNSVYKERALSYGPVAFLEKPFNTNKLITAIEQSTYSTSQFSARSVRKAA